MTRGSRAELRAELMRRVPAGYSPGLHLALLTATGLAVAALALALLADVRAWQLALVPVFVVFGNAVEWHVHRNFLHRRTRPLQILYVLHTPQHHALFVTDDMTVQGARELRFVLLPWFAILAVLAFVSPVPIALAWAGQRNLALLVVATAALYLVAYEWLHLAAHLPARGAAGRLAPMRALRRHHALHHGTHLRHRANFNVTFPLWDLVRGTLHRPSPARARPALARRAAH